MLVTQLPASYVYSNVSRISTRIKSPNVHTYITHLFYIASSLKIRIFILINILHCIYPALEYSFLSKGLLTQNATGSIQDNRRIPYLHCHLSYTKFFSSVESQELVSPGKGGVKEMPVKK